MALESAKLGDIELEGPLLFVGDEDARRAEVFGVGPALRVEELASTPEFKIGQGEPMNSPGLREGVDGEAPTAGGRGARGAQGDFVALAVAADAENDGLDARGRSGGFLEAGGAKSAAIVEGDPTTEAQNGAAGASVFGRGRDPLDVAVGAASHDGIVDGDPVGVFLWGEKVDEGGF